MPFEINQSVCRLCRREKYGFKQSRAEKMQQQRRRRSIINDNNNNLQQHLAGGMTESSVMKMMGKKSTTKKQKKREKMKTKTIHISVINQFKSLVCMFCVMCSHTNTHTHSHSCNSSLENVIWYTFQRWMHVNHASVFLLLLLFKLMPPMLLLLPLHFYYTWKENVLLAVEHFRQPTNQQQQITHWVNPHLLLTT